MEAALKDSEQMEGLRNELRSIIAQAQALKLQQFEIKALGHGKTTSAVISALQCLFDLVIYIQRTDQKSRKSYWRRKATEDWLAISEDKALTTTTRCIIQMFQVMVGQIEETITSVEQAVRERRNGVMEQSLELSETNSSQIPPLERKIKLFEEQLQKQKRINGSSIEKNQGELELLKQKIGPAQGVFARKESRGVMKSSLASSFYQYLHAFTD